MERISPHQFMILGASVLMGTTFLPIASLVTGTGSQSGWMSVLPGFALGIPYGLMIISLFKQYPQKNLLQISEVLLGKWLGKTIGILYILVTGYFGGLILSQVGDIYGASIMPLTPVGMFYLGGALLTFYLVSSGIEVFARFAEIVFSLVVIALVLNIGLSILRIERGELLPILAEGIKPLIAASLDIAPFPMEYILFLAGLLTFLPKDKRELDKLKSGVWRAVFLVGLLNMSVVMIQIMVFGPEETVNLVYGILVLGKMVEISKTIAGVESLFLGAWFGALVIKVSAFLFTVIWGLETVFNLKGVKWNMAVVLAFLGIAYSFQRGPSLIAEITAADNYLILPFTSVWVLALWGISLWKKGGKHS